MLQIRTSLPKKHAPSTGRNGLHPILSSRTPFYDKHILRGVQQGCRQLVLLGAGLDARAFRLDLPTDMAVYEVDMPAVLKFKGGCPYPQRHRVAGETVRGRVGPP